MTKRLTKVGESQALLLPEELLEQLGIGEGDEVELEVHGGTLLVRPAGGGEFREAMDAVLEEDRELLKRLAGA